MEFRDRLNAVLHRRQADAVPFAPYDVLVPRGTFVRQLQNRGMGLLCRRETIASDCPNVAIERKVISERVSRTYYHTPVGAVSNGYATRRYRLSGSGNVQIEWMIKRSEDFEPVIFIVNDTTYHRDDEVFHNATRDLGQDGLVRGTGPLPPYETSENYFGLENWSYLQHDYPEEFSRLIEALEEREARLAPLVLESPAEYITVGSVSGYYSPEQYKRAVLPFYQKYIPLLQAHGKICALHAHNSNLRDYAELIAATGVDVVEAFTPPPVGDLPLAEARAAWGDKTIIWVNFPETVFYEGPQAVRKYLLELLESDPAPYALVFGFTEMGLGLLTAETESFFRAGFEAVADALAAFGGVASLSRS